MVFTLFVSLTSIAQKTIVAGKVVDSETGSPFRLQTFSFKTVKSEPLLMIMAPIESKPTTLPIHSLFPLWAINLWPKR